MKIGFIPSEDIPLVNSLEGRDHMKLTLGTAIVVNLVQEKDKLVLSMYHEKEEPVISLDRKALISLVMEYLKVTTAGTLQKYLTAIIIILQLGISTPLEYHMKLWFLELSCIHSFFMMKFRGAIFRHQNASILAMQTLPHSGK
jgi:hypothetical protein